MRRLAVLLVLQALLVSALPHVPISLDSPTAHASAHTRRYHQHRAEAVKVVDELESIIEHQQHIYSELSSSSSSPSSTSSSSSDGAPMLVELGATAQAQAQSQQQEAEKLPHLTGEMLFKIARQVQHSSQIVNELPTPHAGHSHPPLFSSSTASRTSGVGSEMRFQQVQVAVDEKAAAAAQARSNLLADLETLGHHIKLPPPHNYQIPVPANPKKHKFPEPEVDTGRVFPIEPCEHCKSLVEQVAQEGLQKKLDRYNTVVQTQIACTQLGISQSIDVLCESFETVENWLYDNGMILRNLTSYTRENHKIFKRFQRSPVAFCITAGLCGATAKKTHGLFDNPQSTGATLVRMKLHLNITRALKAPNLWPNFAAMFLHDLAFAIDCSPDRLELHVHKSERYHNMVEVVIRRPSPADTRVPGVRDLKETSLEVAERLEKLMKQNPSPLRSSTALTSLIDLSHKPQLLPLVITSDTLKDAYKSLDLPTPPLPSTQPDRP